jgi:hypothetical protein
VASTMPGGKIFKQLERERVAIEQELKTICAALEACPAQTGFSVVGTETARVMLSRPTHEREDLLRLQREIAARRNAIYQLWAKLRQARTDEA